MANSTDKSKNLPRDVFMYLLGIITLIASAVSFGVLIFQYINIYIPDIVSDMYARSGYFDTIRSYLATVIIVFPVFLWVSKFLRKDIERYPEKRELKIRKWLIYLTLFAAALIMIGDLVTLLRSFLAGELSQRFVLKVFAILFIAGSIFTHYLSELKDKGKEFKWIKFFDWLIIGVIAISVVAGFFIAGSPQNQRLIRLDEQRISDLQLIQSQIINYWQKKESLPSKLDDLVDPISGFVLPRDPETGSEYEYKQLGGLKFQLCGVFSTVSDENAYNQTAPRAQPAPVAGMNDKAAAYQQELNVWWHSQGRTCFERPIDPEMYPPFKKINKQ